MYFHAFNSLIQHRVGVKLPFSSQRRNPSVHLTEPAPPRTFKEKGGAPVSTGMVAIIGRRWSADLLIRQPFSCQ
jgi:hypothetical protein